MSLQTIIDRAQEIEVDRRKMVAQTFSRSQRIKTAERNSAQPWRWQVTPPGALKWADSREILETIEKNDRVTESEVKLSNVEGMRYLTAYQGQLTKADLDAITISTVSTASITITTLPAVSSSTVVFAAGDYIQPANSRYPYTVVSDVLRGSSTTTSVTLNRNIITSEGISLVGQGLNYGNTCTWRMVVTGLPSYKHIPNRLVQFTGNFELVEKIV